MSRGRIVAAIALGLVLAALPFARYRLAAPHPAAHADHAARHGGIVGMDGDLHLEIVRRPDRVEVYPSDAYRRPLRARAGRLTFTSGRAVELAWDGVRLVGPTDPGARGASCTVELADGRAARLSVEF